MTVAAWAGGAAFVASLGYLVYFYAVRLASPLGESGSAGLRAALFDATLFSVFALHHSLFARTGAKAWVTARVPAAVERTLYVWVASVLLIVVCVLWQPLAGVVYVVEGAAAWLLRGVQLAGVVFTLIAARAIDVLSLAGVRHASPAASNQRETITRSGPFSVVRHPIYLGWVLMVGATPLMTANRLYFAALSVAYLILAIPWEEMSLVEVHGDRYRAYQRSVRWRLIPGVW